MILKNGKRIDGLGDNMPIGSIVEYNGTDIPDGWEILPENEEENIYSQEEVRISTWINGKPLYRKVIETTAPSVVGTTTTIATLSSEIQVVKLDGYLHSNANCRYNLNSWFDSTDYIYTFSDMNNHQIRMKVSLDAYKSTKVVLVIEYTKTTD